MNVIKLMKMSLNMLLFTAFVAAVTALPPGMTWADQAPANAKKEGGKIPVAAPPTAEEAAKARAMRDDAIKRRHAVQDYIKKVTEGQQPEATQGTPANAGKEGAK